MKKHNLNNSYIMAPQYPVSSGESKLYLGTLAIITAGHTLDCIRNISIGNYSILAGKGSQLWTHGYYHIPHQVPKRVRVEGDNVIGENVYGATSCIITLGVRIIDNVIVGANSVVSKDLLQEGLYVGQALRHILFDVEKSLRKYTKINYSNLVEDEYYKGINNENSFC